VDAILAWVNLVSQSPWLYVTLFALVLADAFLVILPSETAVVAMGSLALSTGSPNIWLVLPVAALGAVAGDNICYAIGRKIGTTRFRWMRRPRVQAAIEYARTALDRRAASLILTARYIPFARIAANLTAGATGFSYRRYLPLTLVAGTSWAAYNCIIGALFGAWLGEYPILAVLVSIVVAVTLGVAVDSITARVAARRAV
jgi:membrane protein DedA with SNARE-associated domain